MSLKQKFSNLGLDLEELKEPVQSRELEHGFTVRGRPEVYVRGTIRHPDHKTVTFTKWKKVLANAEGGSGIMPGIGWID